jgi:glycine betaine/proline transport system substrate-binding protein
MRLAAVVGAALLGVACSSSKGSPSGAKPTIKFAHNNWLSAELNDAVAQILLQEKMGYPVELVPQGTSEQFDAIAGGQLHVSLEVWPSGHPDQIAQDIDQSGRIERLGPLGPVAQVGWMIPTYLLTDHPELARWQGLEAPDVVSLFATSDTAPRGRFVGGDPTWVQWDQKLLDNLGLDYSVEFAGSEDGEIAMLKDAYARRAPILFYLWKPHWVFAEYDLTMVELPAYDAQDWAQQKCSYPSDALFKMAWPGLAAYAPDAYAFLKAFSYAEEDQVQMMDAVHNGASVDDAARQWIDSHESVWRGWIPKAP